jgi:PKD repeat protein
MCVVRGLAVLSCLALVVAAPAHAAAPVVTVTASVTSGQAPLAVTLGASGDAASYSWDLGDGSSAAGSTIAHTYQTGLWTATVTSTAADGETSRAQVVLRAESISLAAPTPVTYRSTVEFNGSLRPAAAGVPVTLSTRNGVLGRGRTSSNGGFRIRVKAGAPARSSPPPTMPPRRRFRSSSVPP